MTTTINSIADIPAHNFIRGAEGDYVAIRLINAAEINKDNEVWVLFSGQFGRNKALAVRTQLKNEDESNHSRIRIFEVDSHLIDQVSPNNGKNERLEVDDSEINNDFESLLEAAIQEGASDFHMYIRESTGTAIKFRIAGRLKEIATRNYDHGMRMIAMIMGFLSEQTEEQTFQRNKRQSSTIEKNILGKRYRLRAESFPIEGGMKFVARIACMDASGAATIEFEDAGFLDDQIMRIRAAMLTPSGAMLIAGVTGSGKTTTIQAVMSAMLASGDVEAVTIENPVELLIRNATQISITKNISFEEALAAAMRADPDILMVAEIRDKKSAETAVAASITGHNFVSTIHAASPMAINVRLDGFGVARHIMGSPDFYKLLMHQSLIQHICPECSIPFFDKSKTVQDYGVEFSRSEGAWDARIARWSAILDNKPALAAQAENIRMRNLHGCKHCEEGFSRRRSVIAEVVSIDDAILEHIGKHEDGKAARHWLETGGISKYEHATEKVLTGSVCPFTAEKEVGAITHEMILNDGKITKNEVKNLGGHINSERGDTA